MAAMTDNSTKNTSKLQFKFIATDSLIAYARNPRKNDSVVDQMGNMLSHPMFISEEA